MPNIAIIGAGPAGLMAADVISQAGFAVDVFDKKATAARKFLMAGVGGMNITHSEPIAQFITRYNDRQVQLSAFIDHFGPTHIQQWMTELGINNFVGSSGRIFPTDMKAAPLLRRWLQRLRERQVRFFMQHEWSTWQGQQFFFTSVDGVKSHHYDYVILALGAASYAHLGSDAKWQTLLTQNNISINPFYSVNCGFTVAWSPYMQKVLGKPIKQAQFSCQDEQQNIHAITGEAMITDYGIEGSAIYALSYYLQQQLRTQQQARLTIDLLPQYNEQQLQQKFAHEKPSLSTTSLLKKTTPLSDAAIALLYELHSQQALRDKNLLVHSIKHLCLTLTQARPIDEAISCAGGVSFDELTTNLQLKKFPFMYCAGEMLDWSAPTGGYLLTACLAMGHWVGGHVVQVAKKLS